MTCGSTVKSAAMYDCRMEGWCQATVSIVNKLTTDATIFSRVIEKSADFTQT